ncbi:spore coat protein U [Brucella endophytica]|uniref:Spore coat protein U n=1 Tax=Brucella endophytica TaxID=1963359 RepID=A0A916WC87_9HYPH|nr:spore coat protein U domain-containing protein [Brucella endophytica]GGA86555.1 spore coat protein U [Brucella endophytica]
MFARFLLLAILVLLLFPARAGAATCTANVSSLNFGAVDTLSGDTPATATISVDCENVGSSSLTVCGNFGAGSGGASGNSRQMGPGTGGLGFNLYADANHAIPWGHADQPALGLPQRFSLPVSGTTASGRMTLYGLVPRRQLSTRTGSYTSEFTGNDALFYYAEGDTLQCNAPAGASATTAIFTASATVQANCLIEADNINFGTVGLITSPIDQTGQLRITCTPGVGYTIALDGGLSKATNPEQRQMRSGANVVYYGLYSNAAHSQAWGSGGDAVTGEGSGAETRTVYGRVPVQQAAPGHYSDTVVVTITYN